MAFTESGWALARAAWIWADWGNEYSSLGKRSGQLVSDVFYQLHPIVQMYEMELFLIFLLFEIRVWPPFISVLLAMEQVHKISHTLGKNQNTLELYFFMDLPNMWRLKVLLVHCYFLMTLRIYVSMW